MNSETSHDIMTVPGAAKFLDDKGPEDWFWTVNTDSLDMSSTEYDVLGQLYGDYSVGAQELNLYDVEEDVFRSAFSALSEVGDWSREIYARRVASLRQVLVPGRKYRVSGTLEFVEYLPGSLRFKDSDGEFLDLSRTPSTIEEAPWEVREGDVYRIGDHVYQVILDWGVLKVEATGVSGEFDLRDYDFNETHLIYRKEQK